MRPANSTRRRARGNRMHGKARLCAQCSPTADVTESADSRLALHKRLPLWATKPGSAAGLGHGQSYNAPLQKRERTLCCTSHSRYCRLADTCNTSIAQACGCRIFTSSAPNGIELYKVPKSVFTELVTLPPTVPPSMPHPSPRLQRSRRIRNPVQRIGKQRTSWSKQDSSFYRVQDLHSRR